MMGNKYRLILYDATGNVNDIEEFTADDEFKIWLYIEFYMQYTIAGGYKIIEI